MDKHIENYLKKKNKSFNAALMTHHVCDGTCRMIKLNDTLTDDKKDQTNNYVFFCSKSGKVHRCGNMCNTKVTKKSGVQTCVLTGLVFVPDATSLVFQNVTIRTNTYDKKKPKAPPKTTPKIVYTRMNKIVYM